MVMFTLCQRPWIGRGLNILDAIQMILKHRNYGLEESVLRTLRIYLSNVKYKKYKTKYALCIRLMRKIGQETNKHEKEILINELLINILQLNIKNYETSKQQKFSSVLV
jgi:hypothetical protein